MPRRPSLRQLEYLVAIADCEHFGEAAKRCAASQPTLSLQLKSMEDAVGARLVERTSTRVTMTPIGQRAAERARDILLQVDELLELIAGEQSALGGLLRLGAAPTVGPYLLPKIIPSLRSAYPDLKVYIREELPSRLDELLVAGEIDMVLAPIPFTHPQVTAHDVASEELLIGLAAEHPLAAEADADIPPERLKGERFLTLGLGHRLYRDVERLADRHGAELLRDYEGTSLDALRHMVGLGMGMSVFPAYYAQSEIRSDKTVTLKRLAGEPLARTIGLAWRKSSVRVDDYATVLTVTRQALDSADL